MLHVTHSVSTNLSHVQHVLIHKTSQETLILYLVKYPNLSPKNRAFTYAHTHKIKHFLHRHFLEN